MKNDKILIFGHGQMANFYKSYFDSVGIISEITMSDILKVEEIEESVKKFNPTVVINTAAKTNLEWCANNKLEAFNINVLGADNLAQICDKNDIYFIHMSSGCIMASVDENDAKTEEDQPLPISYYSWTNKSVFC